MNDQSHKLSHIEPLAYFLPEFCKKFCVSRSSFYREINASKLRVYKRGKRTMIERAEAERWYANLHGRTIQNSGSSQGVSSGA